MVVSAKYLDMGIKKVKNPHSKAYEFFTLHLYRIQECADEPVAYDASEITHEGDP